MDPRLIGLGGQIVGGFLLGQQQREQKIQDNEMKQKQIDQMLKFAQAREKREERLFEKSMRDKDASAPILNAIYRKYNLIPDQTPEGPKGSELQYGDTFKQDSSAAEAAATPKGPDIAGLLSDPISLAILKHHTDIDWLGAGNAARQNQEHLLNIWKAQREGTQGSWVDMPDGAGGVAKVWQPRFGGPSVGGGVGGYQPPKPELRQFEQGGVTYEQPVNPYTQQPISGANVKTEKKPMAADAAGKMGMLKSGLDAIRQVNSMLMPNGDADTQTYKVLAQMEANLPWTTGRQVGSLMDDALEGKIRIESGAAVPDQEIKRMAKRFKPSVADQPELIKQKLSRMEQYLTGTIEMLDPNKNYSKTAEVFTAQDGKKYVVQPNSKLSQGKAAEYLKRTGGDKGKARELAKRDGWGILMADIFDEVAKRDIFDDVESIGGSMPTSAITGKPLPTDAEKMSMSKQAVGEILPIAGDIAGTAIAPQLKLAASAPRIARAGAGLINMLSRAAGSTAGSVTGETERQVMTQNFDPNQIYIQGAAGAAGELGTSAAAPLLKAVRKPGLELASDLTVSGTKLKQYFTEEFKKQADKRVEKFVHDLAPGLVKEKISDSGLANAVNEAFDENKILYNHYTDGLKAVAEKNGGYVLLNNTVGALETLLKSEMPKHKTQAQAEAAVIRSFGYPVGGQNEYQHVSLRRLMRGEDLSAKETNYLLSHIFPQDTKKFMNLHPEISEAQITLKETILKDLDELGAGAAKRTADEVRRELKNFQRIEGIYKNATAVNKDGERVFNPYTFTENVYRNERVIRTTMPDVWPQIKAEADAMKGVADDIATGKRSMGGLPMLAGLASSHFTGYIPVGEAFGAASAWAMMTPSGKAALSGVFKYGVKPAAKAGLHIGGRLVEMDKSH